MAYGMMFIVIIAAVIVGFIIAPFVKRLRLISKLRSMARETGACVTVLRCPLLSLFRLSARTEIMVETDKRIYLIRLISSQGSKRVIHFANDEYVVSFTRVKYRYVTGGGGIGARKLFANIAIFAGDIVNKSIKVRILPKHIRPEIKTEKPIVDALIFNPAPLAVTCVSNNGTRINLAQVEDTLYGAMVFSGSSFAAHVSRNDDYIRESEATASKS